MRYTPVALALSLAVAMTSSVGYSADRQPDPRAAALVAEGRSELASELQPLCGAEASW